MTKRTRKPHPAAWCLLALLPTFNVTAQPGPGCPGGCGGGPPRTVTVVGHGEVQALPDMATLHLGVSRRGPDLQALREDVAATVARFLELTDATGIERRAVTTSAVNVRPTWRYDRESGERTVTGYEVSRELVVELEALERLGELVEGSVALGVNQATPPRLDVRDRAALKRRALELAAEDARAQAMRLADALGASLGPVRSIDAAGGRDVRPPPIVARAMATSDESGESYETGSLTITADVTVVFDLTE